MKCQEADSAMKKLTRTQQVLFAAAIFLSAFACGLGIFHVTQETPPEPVQTQPLQTRPKPTATTVPKVTAATEPADVTPPVIEGVTDKTVCQGDTVAYRFGVTVTDDTDPAPQLEILNDAVDLNVPGVYTVTYLARDAAGNESEVSADITVQDAQYDEATVEEVNKKVESILNRIIKPDMDVVEQCRAIYGWMRGGRYGYKRNTPMKDIYQSANDFLTIRTGNCYGYFSLCKIMFQQLGIPNIDVHKEKRYSGEGDHYWSLVSPDGGETWYHFDATPRMGSAPHFCLVTDDFLDSYSDSHGGTHYRDKSLYPATPTVDLPGTVYEYIIPVPVKPTTEPTTEPTTQPSTEAATKPSTEASTQPSDTDASTQPTTDAQTQPTIEAATQPSTEAATQPATETPPPTEAPTPPPTEAPAPPAPPPTEAPAPPPTQAPPPPATEAEAAA